ncbi:MAG: hypothetical protein ACI4PR_03600 [Acutalibacteraceae bacterium]
MMSNINSNTISLFAPYYETDNTPFVMKAGGTTYEISTHFSTRDKKTVLQQFKDLLIELDLV